jgi:hypothetical protein
LLVGALELLLGERPKPGRVRAGAEESDGRSALHAAERRADAVARALGAALHAGASRQLETQQEARQ